MRWTAPALLLLAAAGCGADERTAGAGEAQRQPPQRAPSTPQPRAERPPETREAGPSCDERAAALEERVSAVASHHATCRYDVECVTAAVTTECFSPCGRALHPRGVAEMEALAADVASDECGAWSAAGCAPASAECAHQNAACRDGSCAEVAEDAAADDTPAPVPPDNAPDLPNAPPRPPNGSADEKAARLFEAIVHDDPRRASDFFLPREAFLRVKAIADPGAYWDRLFAAYARDIHALHESIDGLERARFDRLEIVRRGAWMAVGEEANALPYWASRHSWLHYSLDGEARKLEVRVLITWDGQWWITHLSEFH